MALDLDQAGGLAENLPFRKRIKMAMLQYADYILGEVPTIPAHNTRVKWAYAAFDQPEFWAAKLQPGVCGDAAVKAAGIDSIDGDSTIDDTALKGSVEATINKMM